MVRQSNVQVVKEQVRNLVFWYLQVKKEFGNVTQKALKTQTGLLSQQIPELGYGIFSKQPLLCITQDAHAATASDGMDNKTKGETKYVSGRGRACPVKVRLSQFLPNHFQEVNMVIQIRWLDQHISCFSQELKRGVFIVKRICFVIT